MLKPGLDISQAGPEVGFDRRAVVDRSGEGLERDRAAIAAGAQRPQLRDVTDAIAGVNQDAMWIAHRRRGRGCVGHAGDVDEAGMPREHLRLAGDEVVERVVHETERARATDRFDGVDGLFLGA